MNEPPQDKEAEEQVLGALLVHEPALAWVLDDVKLRVEDFYWERHRLVFSSISSLHAMGEPVDAVTVGESLRQRGLLGPAGGDEFIFGLGELVSAPGNARAHANIVAAKARWRGRQQAGFKILEAVGKLDEGEIGEARALLDSQVSHSDARFDKARLADIARRLAAEGGAESFPYPFERLNRLTAGGMRRGEFIVLGGHTSHGKTVWVDQVADHLFEKGRSIVLYLTEMTTEERVARTMSRVTGISFERIIEGRMNQPEKATYDAAIEEALKVSMVDATGWSVEEIAADIRASRPDVAIVDTVHDIPHRDTEDLQEIARTLAMCSRQAGWALIGVVHLNRARVKGPQAPRPTRNDILGSGAFAQTANTVCFVHRQETKKGFPTLEGWVYFSKVRNGRLGEVEVTLDPSRYRFEEKLPNGDPGPTPPNESAEKDWEPQETPLPF